MDCRSSNPPCISICSRVLLLVFIYILDVSPLFPVALCTAVFAKEEETNLRHIDTLGTIRNRMYTHFAESNFQQRQPNLPGKDTNPREETTCLFFLSRTCRIVDYESYKLNTRKTYSEIRRGKLA